MHIANDFEPNTSLYGREIHCLGATGIVMMTGIFNDHPSPCVFVIDGDTYDIDSPNNFFEENGELYLLWPRKAY